MSSPYPPEQPPVDPPTQPQYQPQYQQQPQYAPRSNPLASFASTETKPSWKTTELILYVLVVIGIFIASAVVDASDADNLTGFDAHQAWTLITWLTIGYMISRGLAKSGSHRDRDDDRSR